MLTTVEGIKSSSLLKNQLGLLRLVGMWPMRAISWPARALAHGYYWAVVANLSMCTVGLLSKAAITDDLVDRSEAIDIFTLTCTGVMKLLFFSYHHKTMRSLVDLVDTNFPRRPMFGGDQFDINWWMRWSGPLSVAHCATAFSCISFWGICPLLNTLFGVTRSEEMPLPMNVWYPWDTSAHRLDTFVPLYILHYLGLISSTHVYMSCDGFFFSLIYFIIGQITILKLSLRGIRDVEPTGKESLEEAKENALKKCIELHNKIIMFLKELDVVFRTMIVADVLHAIVSLSFAMFQMSESKGLLEMLKMVVFVAYCFIHQYLNSLFGQTLINQQESLMIEAYRVDWPERSKSFRTNIQIMITGSLTPIRFSAWRMYFLQYETFVEFCRMMVSVFMVLRTVKYEK